MLSMQECDAARQTLAAEKEWLPDAFRKRSFQDGLNVFFARLLDKELPQIGSAVPLEIHDKRLTVSRVKAI
jgi:hypothetical protein